MATQLEPNAAACRATPGFIEVSPAITSPQAPLTTEIELRRKDGTRLRLHAPDTVLATIVRSCLEA